VHELEYRNLRYQEETLLREPVRLVAVGVMLAPLPRRLHAIAEVDILSRPVELGVDLSGVRIHLTRRAAFGVFSHGSAGGRPNRGSRATSCRNFSLSLSPAKGVGSPTLGTQLSV
jgi:hypothetical protein